MIQRLSLAQALLSNSDFIILDEPTVGIDPNGLNILENYLIELAEKYEKGILFSSHEIDEVRKICDRVILLREGIITNEVDLRENETVYNVSFTCICEENRIKIANQVNLKVNNSILTTNVSQSELNRVLRILVENNVEINKIEIDSSFLNQLYLN